MDKDYTHLVVVLDESGSMFDWKSETLANLNKFLDEQKKVAGKITFTLVTFNDKSTIVYNGVDLRTINKINEDQYKPDNWTALFDTLINTINVTGKFLADMPEDKRPSKVVFVSLTDGMENASVEYSKKNNGGRVLRAKVQHQRDVYKWQFVFLGADIDAYTMSASLGYARSSVLSSRKTSASTATMYDVLSQSVTSYRCGNQDNVSFSTAQQDDVEEKT